MMSKIRTRQFEFAEELTPPTPDTGHWVVYTRKKDGAPYRWAGSINAPDLDLALQFAREHYGLDESCIALVVHRAEDATDGPCGLDPLEPGEATGQDGTAWNVFTLARRGGNAESAGSVNAPDAQTAIARATTCCANGRIVQIRVVPSERLYETTDDSMLIWRLHDMNYKLARGYSKDVRTKWTRIRDEQTYEDYRKEDIHTHF